jgi:succinate dehydrogenase/fumarate reductase-like Fe-S protein
MPDGIRDFTRLEDCIECGACISACPAAHKNQIFLGPAVLAAINNELKKSPQKAKELLSLAGLKRGVDLCERALNCSGVCPTRVYPARHIADLQGHLEKRQRLLDDI